MADKELVARLKADVSNFSAGMTKALADLEKLDATGKKIGKNSAGWFSEFKDSAMGELTGGFLAANVAMKATSFAIDAVSSGVKDFLEGEKITARLTQSIKSMGLESTDLAERIEALGNRLKDNLNIEDETTSSLAALAINMGVAADKIEPVIEGAVGLSKALGIGMEQALKASAAAFEGNTAKLERLIPSLKDTEDAGKKVEQVFQLMRNGVEIAGAEAKTTAGKIDEITMAWGDMKKAIGSGIIDIAFGIKVAFNGVDSFSQGILQKLTGTGASAGESWFDRLIPKGNNGLIPDTSAPDGWWKIMMNNPGKLAAGSGKSKDELEAIKKALGSSKAKSASDQVRKWISDNQDVAKLPGIGELGIAKNFAFDHLIRAAASGSGLEGEALDKFKADISTALTEMEKMWPVIDTTKQKEREAKIEWQETQATLAIVAGAFDQLKNLLGTLGIELDNTAQGALDVGQGVAEFALNIKNPIAAAGAAIKVLGGIIKMFAGDGIGEAIKREDAWMKLTKEQTEALRKLSEQVGDTHAATSEMLNTIIDDAYINSQGKLDQYARRIREILSDVDNGKMTSAKAAKEIGDSFSSLLKKWENLKLPGITGDMLKLIQDTRGRGIKVQEIADFISAQLQAGVGAAAIYAQGIDSQAKFNRGIAYTMALFTSLQKEGMNLVEAMDALGPTFDAMLKKQSEAGFTSTKGFSELLGIRQFTNDNKDLMDGINATAKLLESLGNSAYLTSELFASFQSDAISDFDKLMKKTGDERKSIMLMLPELSKLAWYAKEYGYALDAQTQALLDKAEAQGFDVEKMKTQEQIMSEMADTMKEVAAIMKDLVDLFGYAFPDAAAKFKAAMELANGAGGGFQPAEPGDPGWNPKGKKGGNGDQPAEPDIKAASGFNGWVNGPTMILAGEAGRERVDIGGGNPGSMINNWYITGTDPDGVAKAIVFAVKNNVYGAGDAIRKTRSN